MYQFDPRRLWSVRNVRWTGVGRNVVFLGLTSFFTDISSEMVASILPMYLVFALRLTPLQYGFIDGLYQGATAIARLASGLAADKWQRNREVAAAGYAVSAFCKVGLLGAGGVWSILGTVILIDRVAKGMRTAPRDALISLSSIPARLGMAFGIHRAFDTAGALLGPLVAFGILLAIPDAYDVVFVASFGFAIVGLATLLLFVRNPRRAAVQRAEGPEVSLRRSMALLLQGRFLRIVVAGTLLSLFTIADAFIYLSLQRRFGLDIGVIPLLYVGTSAAFLVLAIPAGKLADTLGRRRIFVGGHLLLIAGCGLLLTNLPSVLVVGGCLALVGAYYACTDGTLMAIASTVIPPEFRASGLAIVATATGLARFLGSVLFGALWTFADLELAIGTYLGGLMIVILLVLPMFLRDDRDGSHVGA